MKRTILGFYIGMIGFFLFLFTLYYGTMNPMNNSMLEGLVNSDVFLLTIIGVCLLSIGTWIMLDELKKR